MKVNHTLEIKQAGTSIILDVVSFEGQEPTKEEIEKELDKNLTKLGQYGGVTAKLTTVYLKTNWHPL